ncbi:MAG: phosphoribosylglycinamide formyltransferase [Clostridia bacterium]|nr:phosphoribosylglycinamide formyltransferase [Clostridia bacterium]MBR6479506.1 phosphoribosylglycinamide formyltransferase [Clostridia bacterium]MBR6512322.1 phosphoribosylglycinamide formyltransferase [Clostridia bacterium]
MKEKANIAVLVSGGGTNLQALIDAKAAGLIPHGEFVAVISNVADAYALERARQGGIPAITILKSECGSQEDFESVLYDSLESMDVDLIVLAGFLNVLSADFVSKYPKRIINVHPSLIPSFCGDGMYGLKVHHAALERGVKVTGATVHYVNEITDGGEIIMQKAVEVLPNDTPATLQKRVMEEAEWILLPRATELVCQKLLKE